VIPRLRSNRRLVVAVAGGGLLLIAWIAWAVYVTSDKGATAGLGVLIAWPALLAAVALISLPFIWGYLLVRRNSGGVVATEEAEPETSADDEEPGSGEASFNG
jgi:hypothetical protein